ncbi:MAG: rhomboid family intramembrane serine protease [Nitrospira sp.]
MIPLRDDHTCVKAPVVTMGLLVVTIGVFLYQFSLSPERGAWLFHVYGFIPARWGASLQGEASEAFAGVMVSLVTNLFLHAGWLHLMTNMVYLWTFSRKVEDVLGRARFLVFYGLCGMGAVIGYACVHLTSVVPMVGASSAISGVLGAYLLLAPRARILLLMPGYGFVKVSAWIVLVGWFGLQVLMSMFGESDGGGVGFGVHVAGFVIGLALFWGWARVSDYPLWVGKLRLLRVVS